MAVAAGLVMGHDDLWMDGLDDFGQLGDQVVVRNIDQGFRVCAGDRVVEARVPVGEMMKGHPERSRSLAEFLRAYLRQRPRCEVGLSRASGTIGHRHQVDFDTVGGCSSQRSSRPERLVVGVGHHCEEASAAHGPDSKTR